MYVHRETGEQYEAVGPEYVSQGVRKLPVLNIRLDRRTTVLVRNVELVDPTSVSRGPMEGAPSELPSPAELLESGEATETKHPWAQEDWGQLDSDHLDAAPDQPEPPSLREEKWERERLEFEQLAIAYAERFSFHIGNAIIALHDGDLNVAIEALTREHARLYPQPNPLTNPEENPS